jgi:hypothetical protein
MPGKPPPWVDPKPASAAPLIRGLIGLGALLLLGFALTRGNANSGIFIFLAVVCFGIALVGIFAAGVERYGARVLRRNRGAERDLLGGGLLLIALLTPWTVSIPPLHWSQAFGWQTPLAIVAVGAIGMVYVRQWRRFDVVAIVVAATALVAWVSWLAVRTVLPPFAHHGFPFLPIDLLGEGWYLAALALAVTVDGMAARASTDDGPATGADVWPFALIPGMGLLRLHYPGRGRLWLLAVGFAIFLLQTYAVGTAEFQYFASIGSLPPPRPRLATMIPLGLLLLLWIGSLLDTRRALRLEQQAAPSLGKPVRYRRPTVL